MTAETAVVKCAQCGQKNRVSMEDAAKIVRRLVAAVRCGRCKAPLSKGGAQ
jgi:RNase P subunit RPR2